MPIRVQDAIDHLYRTTVVEKKATSTVRLRLLADYCVQELETRGLGGVETEASIPGAGRAKQWDVAWKYEGKYRLGISLKSILRNVGGTVPNRIDDLMGEVANAQLHSPEIVIGYIMLFDTAADSFSVKHGANWCDILRARLANLSGRRPPSWAAGTIEAFVLTEVDFSRSAVLKSSPAEFQTFFDTLIEQVVLRNPTAIPKRD